MKALKINTWFCLVAGMIFVFTGVAKIWSGFGHARILGNLDPVMGLSFGHLLVVVGALELAVAGCCFLDRSHTFAPIIVAWLATTLLAYRIDLWHIGWHRPCSCLGNLTDAVHLSPQVADNIMKGVLAYLLIGSYGILFHQWWRNRKPAGGGIGVQK